MGSYRTFPSGRRLRAGFGRLCWWLRRHVSRCCLPATADTEPCLPAASDATLIAVLKRRKRSMPRPSSLADLVASRSGGAATPARVRDFTIGGSAIDLRASAEARSSRPVPVRTAPDSSPKMTSAKQARAVRLAIMKRKIEKKRSYSVLPHRQLGKS